MTVKALEKLTEIKVRSAKPAAKNYTLSDGEGLFLLVKPMGTSIGAMTIGSLTVPAR